MQKGEQGALHPIGVVARRTGMTVHVLRAWERRYGVIEPVRTAGGQRMYTDAHIERLRLLRQLTEAGRSISHVAQLPDAELRALARADVSDTPEAARESVAERYRRECLSAGERMDGDAAYGALLGALLALRRSEFLEDVLLPLLGEVGDRWQAGRLAPSHEHVVSVAARRVLTWLLDAYAPEPDAPVLVLTTVAGELHEFGAMIAGVVAQEEGWRVEYLGPSLPAEEITRAARQLDARAVAVSIVNGQGSAGEDGAGEVVRLRAQLPGVPVLAGGRGAVSRATTLKEAGADVAGDLAEVRAALRVARGSGARG